MPRIDPVQLLNCLSILLSPNGGVKSRDEVQRIASLMTKFSKKLVSKCIYIQILKCTETELLGLFMGSGGWRLVHMWLTESIVAKNWPLVRELLELLLLCPVDIDRLKTNNCPKLVKELSKDGNHFAIRALASKLVEQWLKTVKGECVALIQIPDIQQIINDANSDDKIDMKLMNICSDIETINNGKLENVEETIAKEVKSEEMVPTSDLTDMKEDVKCELNKDQETLPVLKISLKDGKQVLSQLDEAENKSERHSSSERESDSKSSEREKSKSSSKSKDKNSTSKSSSKHRSDSSHKHKSSSHRRDSSPSRSSRDSKSKDRDKHSSHSSKSSKHSDSSRKVSDKTSSSSKSKDDKSSRSHREESKSKDKDKDKDSKSRDKSKYSKPQEDKSHKKDSITAKETLDKLQPPSIHTLGKIPKLNDSRKEAQFSIEVRKPDEPKPKTVKTFNSKFRKHGLDEEIKPPPSRASLLNKKPSPVIPPTVSMPKRPSPVHNEPPPEKKIKTMEPVEKPGAIKLIPAKPKPMLLLESDMFMDALNASATNKKEPKKRKRRTSGSKDGNGPNDASPPTTPTSIASSPDSKSVPLRFYQDTLDTEDDKEKGTDKIEEGDKTPEPEENNDSEEKTGNTEKGRVLVNGLKSVLSFHKKKGPKKSIKWKPDSELEEIQYFELDETERVNVTKPFTDMKHLERRNEREAFQKGRNLSNDDLMEEKTNWRPLIPIDADGQIPVEHGKSSNEKDIQALRQKGTLQPLYFHKAMIPDSPAEADLETHTYQEPTIIPLDDAAGNQDNVSDFRSMPWPEPKGNAPPASSSTINMPPMFPPNIQQFPNSFPNPQFSVPGFQGPPAMPNEWQNGMPPPHLMPPNSMNPGPMGPAPMVPNVLPPMPHGVIMPPEGMMMTPDMFNIPNQMFPHVPPENFSMFPPNMNMGGPPVMPGPEGMPGPGPGLSFRGAMRGRGGGMSHWRGKGAPSGWDNGPPRGRGGLSRGGRKTVCIYFQRKGSCRQGDKCSFLHPGVNGPF